LGIKTDGTLWATGHGTFGQLGFGDSANKTSFTKVGTDTDWAQVECGSFFSFAVKESGDLYYCGYTYGGAFGNGTALQIETTWTKLNGISVSKISCGYDYTAILTTGGDFLVSGSNQDGQFGHGDIAYHTTFVAAGISTGVLDFCSGHNSGDVSCGVLFVIKSDKTLWAAGSNLNKIMGIADTASKFTFVDTGMTNCLSVHSKDRSVLVSKYDGTLWGCGLNFFGELGTGNTTAVTSFTQVGSLNYGSIYCSQGSVVVANFIAAKPIFDLTECTTFDPTDPYEVSELV
jgi:alpha-tubulin suppressor-like RCC1 family protein